MGIESNVVESETDEMVNVLFCENAFGILPASSKINKQMSRFLRFCLNVIRNLPGVMSQKK